jgi:hypothetical protein
VPAHDLLLVGTLDVREAGVQGAVRDLKTKGRKPVLEDAAASHQLDMYALLVAANHGAKPREVALDVLVGGKRGVSASTLRCDAAASFDPLLFYVERVARMIRAGVFVPVDATGPSGWKCSEKWCGFYDECPMGRARRKVFRAVEEF